LISEAVKMERAEIHATLAQLRLEPVLLILADFRIFWRIYMSSLYCYLNALRSETRSDRGINV
jgi:hypothetical protein